MKDRCRSSACFDYLSGSALSGVLITFVLVLLVAFLLVNFNTSDIFISEKDISSCIDLCSVQRLLPGTADFEPCSSDSSFLFLRSGR
jgi:hypothetical protein